VTGDKQVRQEAVWVFALFYEKANGKDQRDVLKRETVRKAASFDNRASVEWPVKVAALNRIGIAEDTRDRRIR
jgi:hypothetical protein